jgi:hypothetical protein
MQRMFSEVSSDVCKKVIFLDVCIPERSSQSVPINLVMIWNTVDNQRVNARRTIRVSDRRWRWA